MQNHLNKHLGIKPFSCPECEEKFTTQGHRKDHLRSFHSNEKPFECKFEGCGQSFARKNVLKVHTRTHTKERPYVCVTCNARFTESGNLRYHIKIHVSSFLFYSFRIISRNFFVPLQISAKEHSPQSPSSSLTSSQKSIKVTS